MDTRKIRKLIELVKETGIGELEVKSGEESVRINCQTHAATFATPPLTHAPGVITAHAIESSPAVVIEEKTKPLPPGHTVKSPMVGTIYLASTPGSAPFVSVGQHVSAGDTLCLIEAMKMFNKIEADCSGVISARLVDNEQPIEYDQALFIIDTGA